MTGAGRRLASLDAFRGLVVAAMLVVNNPGRPELAPAQLRHAAWGQGITFADLVMPAFLFAIGVSLPFALESALGKPGFWRRALGRCFTLLVLGVLLVSSAQRRLVIGLDVLQHLGIAGLLATTIYAWAGPRRLFVAAGIALAHTVLLRCSGPLDEHDNVVARLNRDFLAPLHLAGLLGPCATTALVLLGSWVGTRLRDASVPLAQRARALAVAGVVFAGGGWVWHLDLAFSKPLWTAPYLLWSAGLCTLFLTGLHVAVEGRGMRWLALPWIPLGRNAILAYFGAIVIKHHTVDEWQVATIDPATGAARGSSMREAIVGHYVEWFGPGPGSLAWTLTWLVFVAALCAWLHRRGLYWRV